MNIITPQEVRAWFASADDDDIDNLLDCGLADLIADLEQDDFFGTEGFSKRFG